MVVAAFPLGPTADDWEREDGAGGKRSEAGEAPTGASVAPDAALPMSEIRSGARGGYWLRLLNGQCEKRTRGFAPQQRRKEQEEKEEERIRTRCVRILRQAG